VWAIVIVFIAPLGDFAPRIEQIPKPARVQTFITEFSRETLHVAVLHGPARLNMNETDPPFNAPRQEMP